MVAPEGSIRPKQRPRFDQLSKKLRRKEDLGKSFQLCTILLGGPLDGMASLRTCDMWAAFVGVLGHMGRAQRAREALDHSLHESESMRPAA